MVFPAFQIDEVRKETGCDLTRFDLDFDLPDHLLSESPAPIYEAVLVSPSSQVGLGI